MSEYCLALDKLPTNAEILRIALEASINTRTRLESQSVRVSDSVEQTYRTLQIPILSRNVVRKRYLQLVKFHKNDQKRPNQKYGERMLQLFHVAKCNCFVENKLNGCHCLDKDRIPASSLKMYADQLGPRNWKFKCDCSKSHVIRTENGAIDEGDVAQSSNITPPVERSKSVGLNPLLCRYENMCTKVLFTRKETDS